MGITVPISQEGNHDFEFASRGLIAAAKDAVIVTKSGSVVWDTEAYAFMQEECPSTANQLLWRQGQLCSTTAGLYQVTEGVYQVRGLDIANMSIIQIPKTNNVFIIDCLTASEVAASAIQLYQDYHTATYGQPASIVALLYTHCHGDHFGGAQAVADAAGGPLTIIAPDGFLEHAVSENVYAGPVMTRRSIYMYGQGLQKSPTGQIGCGLGQAVPTGTSTLIAPTQNITQNGTLNPPIDGIDIECQLTPGTEAPAEVNFWIPAYSALCMAENATHTLHNIQTLRGAPVRDARLWSKYLDDAITSYGDLAEVVFSSHHWPTWKEGDSNLILTYLNEQRDTYAYIHNESLRHFNAGLTPVEIAEEVKLPPSLATKTNLQGYYGSVSHNTKAVYDKYLGWFDGNPANLWPLTPVKEATEMVKCMGGADNVLKLAKEYVASENLRFAASLLNKLVFYDANNTDAKNELASVYTRLGQGAENGTWRNIYLTGAYELQNGAQPAAVGLTPQFMMALSLEQLFDMLAIQINGPEAATRTGFTIEFLVSDIQQGSGWHLRLSNGVVTGRDVTYVSPPNPRDDTITLSVWVTHEELTGLVGAAIAGKPTDLSRLLTSGDTSVWNTLTSLIVVPNTAFNIVTP